MTPGAPSHHAGDQPHEQEAHRPGSDRAGSPRPLASVELNPARVLRWIALAIAVLLLSSVLSQIAWYQLGDRTGLDFIRGILWVDSEQSLPTLFSVLLLLTCAGALRATSVVARRTGAGGERQWKALSWIFVYLACDDAFELHERLIDPVREGLGLSGILYYAWVVPAAFAVLVVAALFAPFVWNLPTAIRRLVILAGVMYVVGAIGFELLATDYVLDGAEEPRPDLVGNQGLGYVPYSTTEEGLEMGGPAILLYATLRQLRDHLGSPRLMLGLGTR